MKFDTETKLKGLVNAEALRKRRNLAALNGGASPRNA
jgi:hypothetical protein